jgi:1-acyl-sn-glycerol-3-phosphate acyltransferase
LRDGFDGKHVRLRDRLAASQVVPFHLKVEGLRLFPGALKLQGELHRFRAYRFFVLRGSSLKVRGTFLAPQRWVPSSLLKDAAILAAPHVPWTLPACRLGEAELDLEVLLG